MDMETYEEVRVPRDDSWAKWLPEVCPAQHLAQARTAACCLNRLPAKRWACARAQGASDKCVLALPRCQAARSCACARGRRRGPRVQGKDCDVVFFNGAVISVDPGKNLVLKVVKTDPGTRGNTVQGGTKPATVETGATLQVPHAARCLMRPCASIELACVGCASMWVALIYLLHALCSALLAACSVHTARAAYIQLKTAAPCLGCTWRPAIELPIAHLCEQALDCIQVPLFIDEGMDIKVDTEAGKYISRANE
jgi:Elongation factor P, C-terminal